DQRHVLVRLEHAPGRIVDLYAGHVDELHRSGRRLARGDVADDARARVVVEREPVGDIVAQLGVLGHGLFYLWLDPRVRAGLEAAGRDLGLRRALDVARLARHGLAVAVDTRRDLDGAGEGGALHHRVGGGQLERHRQRAGGEAPDRERHARHRARGVDAAGDAGDG